MPIAISLQQLIPPPSEGQSAWQYVAYVALLMLVAMAVFMFKENKKLTEKIAADAEKRATDWQTRSETCQADMSKTTDAVKTANDSNLQLIGKVDKLAGDHVDIHQQIEENSTLLKNITTRVETCTASLEKILPKLGAQ
jgi:septal ring factor EnvC (AmiA/AmiB activator)